MGNNNQEKTLIEKIKGTISDLNKGENLVPINERMSANKKRFENLHNNRTKFQGDNKQLLENLKSSYEKWNENLSEADSNSDTNKQIKWYMEQIINPVTEQAIPEKKTSQDEGTFKKEEKKNSTDSNKQLSEKVKSEEKRNPNPHRQLEQQKSVSKITDTGALKKELKIEIQNLQKKLLDPISFITSQVQTTLVGVGNVEKEFKKLADDIVYKNTKANKDQSTLSEIEESVSTLPAKMNKVENLLNQIDSKLDTTGSQKSMVIPSDIPEDEKAILELSRYMQDGLEQLENIARYHISKQREIEKTEKKASDIEIHIEEVKNDAYVQGQRDAQIKLVKSIHSKHPRKFEEIRSVFEDIVTEKYTVGEKIPVTEENKQTLEVTIDGIQEIGEYSIETVALMIDDETLVPATVKKIEN